MKKKFACTIVFVLFVFLTASFADTIYMKDGSEVSGEIIEDDNYKVIIKVGKFPRVFYRNQIKSVIKDSDAGVGGMSGIQDAMKKIDNAKAQKELVLRLLNANGTRESLIIMVQQILASVPDEARDDFTKILQIDKILDQIIPIYMEYYTVEDIKALISFYKSSVGIKHVEIAPQVMEETMTAIADYFSQNAMKLEIEPVETPLP
jgi:hypothetical protein